MVDQIRPGVFLFKSALDLKTQGVLADWYRFNKHHFYTPVLRSGHKMNLTMHQLGKHWSAKDYNYYDTRKDIDDKPVKVVPEYIKSLIKNMSSKVFPYHNPDWDIMIANHYMPEENKLGMHSDNSESQEALDTGHPVVSISIGASCLFKIEKDNLMLNSGDVLIFGGPARLDKHGITKVLKTDYNSLSLHKTIGAPLNNGRLNLTLRKY